VSNPKEASNAVNKNSTSANRVVSPALRPALEQVTASFERFCLLAGLDTLNRLMEWDATALCGPRHGRGAERQAHRWGRTKGRLGFHGGRIEVVRPRVRGRDGKEIVLPSWERAQAEDWLGPWAMNLMLLGVSTRRFGRAVRLPEADVPAGPGSGVSKSAASRRFVALSAERLVEWLSADLSGLDLLVVQIDGMHVTDEVMLVAAVGIDGEGRKHPLGLVEGATENAAVVQALLDDLMARGLDPAVPRLFIIDGSKALARAIRRTFGENAPIQRCQVRKARATSSTGCLGISTPRPGGRCDRPGNWTTPRRRRGCCATLPAAWNAKRRLSRRRSSKGSMRSSPWSGWDCRGSCGDPWPAPTSSRTCWGRSGASAATSSAGATPRWPCAGPPPPCSRPPRASAGSRRKANSHSCAPPSSPTSGSPPGPPRLLKARMPHSLNHQHAEHAFQQRSGHPRHLRQ